MIPNIVRLCSVAWIISKCRWSFFTSAVSWLNTLKLTGMYPNPPTPLATGLLLLLVVLASALPSTWLLKL